MTVIESMITILRSISGWFVDAFEEISGLFYNTETGLTFVGTLAVIGLGIGLILLVINTIRRWIGNRG